MNESADAKDIKASFYSLAKKYHPDIAKGSEEKFKEINEAFEVLSDENRRKAYDSDLKYGFSSSN